MDFCKYMMQSRGQISRVAAGSAINASPRTIEAWEYGRCKPGPEHVVAMARAYRDPDMRFYYCNHACAIGQAYGYRVLNRVDISKMAVLAKLEDELGEAIQATRAMLRLALNKRARDDYSGVITPRKEKTPSQGRCRKILPYFNPERGTQSNESS